MPRLEGRDNDTTEARPVLASNSIRYDVGVNVAAVSEI